MKSGLSLHGYTEESAFKDRSWGIKSLELFSRIPYIRLFIVFNNDALLNMSSPAFLGTWSSPLLWWEATLSGTAGTWSPAEWPPPLPSSDALWHSFQVTCFLSQWFLTCFIFLKIGIKRISLTISIETLILMSFGLGNSYIKSQDSSFYIRLSCFLRMLMSEN